MGDRPYQGAEQGLSEPIHLLQRFGQEQDAVSFLGRGR